MSSFDDPFVSATPNISVLFVFSPINGPEICVGEN